MTKCLSNINEYVTIFTAVLHTRPRDMGPLVDAHPWRLRNDVQLYPGEASDSGVSHKQLLNGESNTAGKQDKGPCTRLLEEQETLTVVS